MHFMNRQQAISRTSPLHRRSAAMLQAIKRAAREWGAGEGLIWLHLFKTVVAVLGAMGIAMLLDLPQPRIAMTTVFVLMQPLSGMVLAKSFYRIVGTAVGTIAALVLGAVFVQQPEWYVFGLTVWVAACTAAAVRNRHFRWYGFVLAGYTAALIGTPLVMQPNALYLAALGRAAEVAVGIVCSSAVSALIVPMQTSTVLLRTLHVRYANFTALASSVLSTRLPRGTFERRFADLVDAIVGFEATRVFAAFEDPSIRMRSQHLARLNSEFMDLCARLHALRQLLKRLHWRGEVIESVEPYFHELASLLSAPPRDGESDGAHASRVSAALGTFQASLPKRMRSTRHAVEARAPSLLPDFDTSGELLYRFVSEFMLYANTYASLAIEDNVSREPGIAPYMNKTNGYVVAFMFLRTALVMAMVGWFWIETDWPSGSLALTGAALTCALTSSAPNATRLAFQMAVGALFATAAGYVFTSFVYPAIDGFPLLCAALTPVLAAGAFLMTRRGIAGYGVGFSVFFCLLAGPDNVIAYAPMPLINNGMAIVASMLAASVGFAVVFPPDMGWLIDRMCGDLRRQGVFACHGVLPGLNRRFQSGTHDLMFQLRMLLTRRSRRHRDALRWMLVTLEVGHAIIDLRKECAAAAYVNQMNSRWNASIDDLRGEIARLFARPDKRRLVRALLAVRAATWVAQDVLDRLRHDRDRRHDLQRMLSCLHFIRTALLDRDAPLGTLRMRSPRSAWSIAAVR